MNRFRTTFAVFGAISILVLSFFVSGPDWSQSEHLWLVPIRLGLEAAIPFFVATVVATLIAGRRFSLPFVGIWAAFWLVLPAFFGALGLFSNPPTYWEVLKWNIPGAIFSLLAGLVGTLLTDIFMRKYRNDSHTAT